MYAVRQNEFGAPGVLTVAEIDRPEPIPSEVLVRVEAAAVNPVDAMVRSGAFPLLGPPPFVLGWDVAGVVESVVPGVTRFALGDRVFGMPFFPRSAGAYAEYVAVPSRQLARIPSGMDAATAAALPMAGLTAWQALVDAVRLAPGQRILIHGGGGGVGHLAIQIAKARGAIVITTASQAKHDFVRGLGADEVIDYRAVDFVDAVRDIDVVFDTVGGPVGRSSLSVLRPSGRLVTIVERGDAELTAATIAAGMTFVGITVEPDYVSLEHLAAAVAAGRIRPHVDRVIPLADAAAAHELIESGATQGKLVLRV